MTRNLGRYVKQRLRAIIFVRSAGDLEAITRCLDHIRHRNYRYVGVVTGDPDTALQLLDKRRVDVCVVDRGDDIPPEHLRRYEVVAEARRQGVVHRRTRRVIRPGGAA